MQKKALSSTERIMDALSFMPPDRVGRFDSYWPEFEIICREVCGIPENTSLEVFFDIDIRILCPNETIYPSGVHVILDDGKEIIYKNGWGAVMRQKKGTFFEEEIEPCFEDMEGLIAAPCFENALLPSRYKDFDMLIKKYRGEGACIFGKIGGLYIRSAFICGTENFMYQIAADPEFAKELAERLARQQEQIAIEELRRGDLYDTGIWIYDDIASNMGPIMSPDAFAKIYYPAYKKLIGNIKKAGAKKVLLHSDGNIELLLDMFIDAGIDGINPIEPKAGMNIPKLLKKYGARLSYVGGMCNSHTLVTGTKKDIEREAREILDCAKNGGVVIGSHSVGPDIPIENYLHYIKTVQKYGSFI